MTVEINAYRNSAQTAVITLLDDTTGAVDTTLHGAEWHNRAGIDITVERAPEDKEVMGLDKDMLFAMCTMGVAFGLIDLDEIKKASETLVTSGE